MEKQDEYDIMSISEERIGYWQGKAMQKKKTMKMEETIYVGI